MFYVCCCNYAYPFDVPVSLRIIRFITWNDDGILHYNITSAAEHVLFRGPGARTNRTDLREVPVAV